MGNESPQTKRGSGGMLVSMYMSMLCVSGRDIISVGDSVLPV